MQLSGVGVELRGGELVDDASVLHDVIAIGYGGGETEILLDQEDGEALRLEGADGTADLLHDDRRQAFGRFVEQQQPRAGAQDSCDRQHLLLAAGELGALAAEPLTQVREQRENAVEIETAGAHLPRQQQVLLDVERGEDAALLGAERDPRPRNRVGGKPDQLLAFELYRPGTLFDDPHDGFERRGLADAVASEERDHFARLHGEGDAVQDVQLAVPGIELVDRQQVARLRHDRSRDRLRAPLDRWTPFRSRPRPARGRG